MLVQTYCTFCTEGRCSDGENADPDSPLEGDYGTPCGIYKPANVISISYGGPEQNFPATYQRRQCHEYVTTVKILIFVLLNTQGGLSDMTTKQVYEAWSPRGIGPICLW